MRAGFPAGEQIGTETLFLDKPEAGRNFARDEALFLTELPIAGHGQLGVFHGSFGDGEFHTDNISRYQ